MSKHTYEISTDSFTAAVAVLVAQFEANNESVGEFRCTTHGGTKVTIKLKSKPAKVSK